MKPEFNLKQTELLLEIVEAECVRLDRKISELDRSQDIHRQLGDLETIARIQARQKRLTQLQAEAYELHEILYFSQYGRPSDKQLEQAS